MFIYERIIASSAIAWAILMLLYQVRTSKPENKPDFSVSAGSPFKGILYNFSWAMLPSHKESIRLHPFWFLTGALMHIGIFAAILKVLTVLVSPQFSSFKGLLLEVVLLVASICAIILLIKRIFSKTMRSMSSPDDFISILLVVDFLIAALSCELGVLNTGAFLVHSAVLFFYLPLGKLKHALFFFVARAEYGARLGYRGIYPVKSGSKEHPDER